MRKKPQLGRTCAALVFALAIFGFWVPAAYALEIVGQKYLGLADSAKKLGMRAGVSSDGKTVWLKGASDSAKLALNRRDASVNGVRVWLNFALAEEKGAFYLSQMDFDRTLHPLIFPQVYNLSRYKVRHIVLDAGHGGRDVGAQNAALKLNEKTLTLDVALRLKQRLETAGYRVSLTRSADKTVPLQKRTQLANGLNADLFLSIHFNSADPTVEGIETYVYTPRGAPSSSRAQVLAADKLYQPANAFDTASLWLGYEVQKAAVRGLASPDRALRRARFVVLEGLECPGVLFEGGFLSSPREGARIASTLYRQQLANALMEGIVAFDRRTQGLE